MMMPMGITAGKLVDTLSHSLLLMNTVVVAAVAGENKG